MADDLQEPDLPGDEHLGEAPYSDEQVLMALDRAVCSAAGCLEPAECMHFFTSGLSEDAELVFSCHGHGEDWMYPVDFTRIDEDGWEGYWRHHLGRKRFRGDLLVEAYVRRKYDAPPALAED
jgi:hypothetical protein